MKPSGAKKAARKISPSQVDAVVKHLGGKPMTRNTHFTGPLAKVEPKAHQAKKVSKKGVVTGASSLW